MVPSPLSDWFVLVDIVSSLESRCRRISLKPSQFKIQIPHRGKCEIFSAEALMGEPTKIPLRWLELKDT